MLGIPNGVKGNCIPQDSFIPAITGRNSVGVSFNSAYGIVLLTETISTGVIGTSLNRP